MAPRTLVAALCLGLVQAPAAQEAPQYRVAADLVVVDAVAIDRDGRFVADLQAADFELREDGETCPVRFVERVGDAPLARAIEPGQGSVPAPPASRESIPTDSRPLAGSRAAHLVIAIDDLSFPVDAFPRVRDELLRILRTHPSDLPVMLATIGRDVRVLQPFTTDRPTLLAAAETLPPALAGQVGPDAVFDQVEKICHAARPDRIEAAALDAGRQMVIEANERSRAASASLSMLAQSLVTVEGRKQIVLFSAGYAISPANQAIDAVVTAVSACGGAAMDTMRIRRRISEEVGAWSTPEAAEGLHLVVDRANRAQVSFYVVDPRGLTTGMISAQSRGNSRISDRAPAGSLTPLSSSAGSDYLVRLATDTGGRAFVNTNDMGAGFRLAREDARAWYLIGYAPRPADRKSRFRRIQLAVKRPGVTVRHRQGYYAIGERERAAEDIERALLAPGAFLRPGFGVQAGMDGGQLKITVAVPPAAVRFMPVGDEFRAEFSVHAELRDTQGRPAGRPIPGRDVTLRGNAARVSELRAAPFLRVELTSAAPRPGSYRLTVVARDSSGWIAARSGEITISP